MGIRRHGYRLAAVSVLAGVLGGTATGLVSSSSEHGVAAPSVNDRAAAPEDLGEGDTADGVAEHGVVEHGVVDRGVDPAGGVGAGVAGAVPGSSARKSSARCDSR